VLRGVNVPNTPLAGINGTANPIYTNDHTKCKAGGVWALTYGLVYR
jgi:hypothetical protein